MEFVLRAFLFGMASYTTTYILYSLAGWQFTVVDISDAGDRPVLSASVVHEIAAALVVGIVLSLVWIYAATYKWLSRGLQLIKATKRYGDEDVWDYTFNSQSASVEYVHFRDFSNGLTYAGWVNAFSETGKLRELLLRDVRVFNLEGDRLFELR